MAKVLERRQGRTDPLAALREQLGVEPHQLTIHDFIEKRRFGYTQIVVVDLSKLGPQPDTAQTLYNDYSSFRHSHDDAKATVAGGRFLHLTGFSASAIFEEAQVQTASIARGH